MVSGLSATNTVGKSESTDSRTDTLLVLVFFMGFIDNNKMTEYRQPHPVMQCCLHASLTMYPVICI